MQSNRRSLGAALKSQLSCIVARDPDLLRRAASNVAGAPTLTHSFHRGREDFRLKPTKSDANELALVFDGWECIPHLNTVPTLLGNPSQRVWSPGDTTP